MAKSTFNSVPRGIGSGAAQVLGKSRALENLLETIDYNQKMGLLNQQSQSREKIATNKDFVDNAIQAKGGILYQPEISSATQKWIDTGAKYRQQGFNPFNPDPNDPKQIEASNQYIKDKQLIEGMAQTRDKYQENYLKQQDAYEKGGYDEDSWIALNDFYKNNKLSDLHQAGAIPPTLMQEFNSADFLKGISAPTIKSNSIKDGVETKRVAANEDAIRFNLENSIPQSPQAKRWFNKQFSIDEAKLPAKTFIGSIDPKEVGSTLDAYYKSPKGMEDAAKAFPPGTVVSYNAPEYQKFLQDQTNAQLQQEQRREYGLQTLTKQKAAGVNTEMEKSYNFDLENQGIKRADQAMQRTRFGWDAENQNNTRADRAEKKTQENIRDRNIQGIQVGNREDIQTLRQLAKAKGGYVQYDKDGRLVVTWNSGKNADGSINPQRQVIDLSEKKNDGYAQINEILNNLTGKKQDIETMQGKTPYAGSIVNVGDKGFTKSQIEMLRENFKDDKDGLGKRLRNDMGVKTWKEALELAGEILDNKGNIHKLHKPK